MVLPRFLSNKVVRVLITGAVLTVLAVSIDLRETVTALLRADVRWLFVATLVILLIRVIMAVRWWWILSAYGFSVGIWEITKLIFVTSSLGNVLPIGVGQDLLRGYHVVRTRGRLSDVSATILVDRALGMISMALVAVVASLLGARSLQKTPALVTGVVVAVAILLGFGILYLVRSAIHRWAQSRSAGATRKIAEPLKQAAHSLFGTSLGRATVVAILMLSVLVQVARSAAFIFVYAALGVSTDSFYYFVTIPLVFMLIQLPVSLGGLGVREGALVVFFRDVGFTPEVSVAGGLIFYGLQLIAFLPGFVLFLFGRDQREPRAAG